MGGEGGEWMGGRVSRSYWFWHLPSGDSFDECRVEVLRSSLVTSNGGGGIKSLVKNQAFWIFDQV